MDPDEDARNTLITIVFIMNIIKNTVKSEQQVRLLKEQAATSIIRAHPGHSREIARTHARTHTQTHTHSPLSGYFCPRAPLSAGLIGGMSSRGAAAHRLIGGLSCLSLLGDSEVGLSPPAEFIYGQK